MAFARAIGEIGSIVIISGNRPFRTEVASVWILNQSAERQRHGRRGARRAAARDLVPRPARRRRRCAGSQRGTSVRKIVVRSRARLPRSCCSARSRCSSGAICAEGAGKAWTALTEADTLHAFKVTLEIAAIAVPLNTIFGIVVGARDRAPALPRQGARQRVRRPAARALARRRRPVAVPALRAHRLVRPVVHEPRVQILFALPAMVLATVFVSVPYVAREVIPTLREIGDEQEQAAHTLGASGWQTFWRITLPSIRWAVIYGVVRHDRALPRRVRRRRGRLRSASRAARRLRRCACRTTTRTSTRRGAYGVSLTLGADRHRRARAHDPLETEGRDRLMSISRSQRHEAVRKTSSRSTTSRSTSTPVRSRRCSARAAAASRRCCASSPGSRSRTRARSSSPARTRRRSPRRTAASASCSSTTPRSST